MLTHPVGRNFKVGQKVHFGRPNGEKTLGEIIKLNPSKARIRTLEDRGSRSVAGVVWTVPYSLIKPAEGAEATLPTGLGLAQQITLDANLRGLIARFGLTAVSERLQKVGAE